jgi:cytoskeleton protein RodZ
MIGKKNIKSDTPDTNPTINLVDLGATLREAREAKRLTIQDVVDAIHLSQKQVNALETNDFTLLPEPMITRGFIRSYARLLEIDSAPLLASHRSLVPSQEVGSIVVRSNVNQVMTGANDQPWLMYILSSILVLLFLISWMYYYDSTKTMSTEEIDTPIVADAPAINSENTVTSQVQVPMVDQTPSGSDGNIVAVNPEESLTNNQAASGAIEDTHSSMVVDTNNNPEPANAIDADKPLVFSFDQESWLSIKDANGQVVFEKLMPAGTVQGFDGLAPFKVVIGNALGAKVKFKGSDVDLTVATKGSVARLTLE